MKRIKLFDPSVEKKEKNTLLKVFDSHYWSSGSGNGSTKELEQTFKNYVGSTECVAVNSGSSALHLALSLIDLKGKEVILPSLTFTSTANAVKMNGGKPIFVDVDLKDCCMDVTDLKEKISHKTKAIIPVHFGGLACNLEQISNIAKKNNLEIVEDAAHAAGTIHQNKKIGSHSFAVCHSFNPTKNIASPSGGAITLNGKNSSKNKKILNARRWCGLTNRRGYKYDVKEIGWNYFIDEFSASIATIQIKKLDKMKRIKQKIAKRYSEELNATLKMPFNSHCSYHLFWIFTKKRKQFMKELNNLGIECGIHYQPLHLMSLYKIKNKLKNTDFIGKHIVSLPMHSNLKNDDVSRIIKSVNHILEKL